MRSNRSRRPCTTVLLLLSLAVGGGCTGPPAGHGDPDAAPSRGRVTPRSGQAPLASADPESYDLGEDWFEIAQRAGAARHGGGAVSGGSGPSSIWMIVLRTFRTGDPQEAPRNFIESCAAIDPGFARARVIQRPEGRMVVYGEYPSADDPQARRDLEWVKSVTFRGQPLLPRAMLARLNLRHLRGEFLPNELVGVRQRYPNTMSIFTLQVAAWGDFGSGTLSRQDVQARAEAFARDLRARGYEAYFHHDDDQVLSVVTIGIFDSEVYDAQSGMFTDPRVSRLMREFPAHLINGEPLDEPVDPRFPQLGTRTQRPRLVEVPKR